MPDLKKIGAVLCLSLVFGQGGQAQVGVWQLGGNSGTEWVAGDSTSVLVDFDSAPGAIQPVFLDSNRTVYSYLENWSPNKVPRDLGFVNGERERAWRGGAGGEATDRNGTYQVDGDSTTYNPVPTRIAGLGAVWYTIDTAVPVPAFRFGFFPPTGGFRADGTRLEDDVVPAYEVSIGADAGAAAETPSYRRLPTLIAEVQENLEPRVQIPFQRQYVRFARFRRLVSLVDQVNANANSAGGVALSGSVGDFELFAWGVPQRVNMLTQIADLGRKVNFGRLHWSATPMRVVGGVAIEDPDADVGISFLVRTGLDADPNVYHEFTEKSKEKVVSRQRYEFELQPPGVRGSQVQTGKPGLRASIQYDTANWSFWSPPFTTSGQPLNLRNGSHLQLKIILHSNDFDAYMRLDSLWVETAPLLATQIKGEVALEADPAPRRGFTQVELGARTQFVYQIQAEFDDSSKPGFDGVRLRTGGEPRFVRLEMGQPLAPTEPEEVLVEGDDLVLTLPRRITRANNVPVRVVFEAAVFSIAATFESEVVDSRIETLPQQVLAGDVTESIGTNSLSMQAARAGAPRAIGGLRLASALITPNGDGINDRLRLAYELFGLPEAVPVVLRLYGLDGGQLDRVDLGLQQGGEHEAEWDGRLADGSLLPVGMYLVEIAVDAEEGETRRLRSFGVAY
jgi:hypothetical protein